MICPECQREILPPFVVCPHCVEQEQTRLFHDKVDEQLKALDDEGPKTLTVDVNWRDEFNRRVREKKGNQ